MSPVSSSSSDSSQYRSVLRARGARSVRLRDHRCKHGNVYQRDLRRGRHPVPGYAPDPTAVGDGTTAAIAAERYIEGMPERLEIAWSA